MSSAPHSKVSIRPEIAALPGYVPGGRAPGPTTFKLSSNENPFPPLPSVLAAIADAAADVNRYPDMYATALVRAIGDQVDLDPTCVVAGNGSVAVLSHVLAAICRPGDEVVYAWRSFEAYPIVVTVAGATSVQVPLTADGRHDLGAMAEAIGPATRAVIVCSPNNPTGTAVGATEMAEFMDRVPRDVLVLLDEAYLEFVTGERIDGLKLLAEHPNLVLLRTFSKAYGLAGLRVGYALARPRLAEAFRTASTPFGVNALAQVAAIESLAHRAELIQRVDAIVAERARMVAGLHQAGWQIPDPQGNFVWLALGEAGKTFADAAAHTGAILRPFAEGVRITVGEPAATDLVLDLAAEWSPASV